MHRDLDKKRFREGMEFLRERYGLFAAIEEAEWRRKLAAYFEQLKPHEWGDVCAALGKASDQEYYPERFPTAGQLERVVLEARQHRVRAEGQQDAAGRREAEERRAIADYDATPILPEDQQRYIDGAEDQYDRLAREWRCESKRLGLDPNKPSPPDIVARRSAQLDALLGDFGQMPSTKQQQPQPPETPAQETP